MKELENFSDNIDLKIFPAKPDNNLILYERLIKNLQSDELFVRHQLKTRDVFFKEEITYLRNQLVNCLRCSCYLSKKENKASIHQKRKPNPVKISRASESTKKQKDDTSKKDNIGEKKKKKKKNSSSKSNQVVTSDQSVRQPSNRKQSPKEQGQKEKYLHLGREYDKAFKRVGHFCKAETAS